MLDLLASILCVLRNILLAILSAGIWVFNAVVELVGTLVQAAVNAAPTMPDPPALPTPFDSALGWIAWFWPVGTTVALIGFVVLVMVVWFFASIVLRWVRVVE